jgi:hypothetical protein
VARPSRGRPKPRTAPVTQCVEDALGAGSSHRSAPVAQGGGSTTGSIDGERPAELNGPAERRGENNGPHEDPHPAPDETSDRHADKWLFGFQRGVMVASRSQLGRPA